MVPTALPDHRGSVQQLPNFVGLTFSPHTGYTVGAALLATNTWHQETDSELFSTVPAGQQRFWSLRRLRVRPADRGDQRGLRGCGRPLARGRRPGVHHDESATGGQHQRSHRDHLGPPVAPRVVAGIGVDATTPRTRRRAVRGRARETRRCGPDTGGAARAIRVDTFDGVLAGTSGSRGASVFDGDARFEYHLPWEFQGGAAIVAARAEMEVDLQSYWPIAYSLLSTSQPLLVYSGGPNTPPTVSSQAVRRLTSASDGVVNVSVGGHAKLLGRRDFRVHGGIASNRSPVASADTVFSKVNLVVWSVGVSGTFGKLQFSAGLSRQAGSADDATLRNLLNGDDHAHSRIDVRTTGFIYSLAYQF